MSLLELSLTEVAAKLKAREVSATEVTQAVLDRITQRNPAINAFVTPVPDHALAMAKASDARLAKGEAGLLEGVPLGVKDLYCTQGIETTACSNILRGFVPPYESTVTQNLWNAGAVNLGKLNMDQFAMGSSNETSCFGNVRNPLDEERTPGGSSGGSAAAVADFQCYGATGSDTGGSTRLPASYCGVVGVRPTYGRASRYGMVAFASSLDQAGMIARTVEDAALMHQVVDGYDEKDSTSVNRPVPKYSEMLGQFSPKGLKIGLPKEYFIEGLDPRVKALIEESIKRFAREGAEVVEISLPHTKYALPTYYIIAPAEASSNLARYDGMRYGARVEGDTLADTYINTRTAGFGREVKRRIMIGNYTLSSGYYDAFYTKAQKLRTLITQDFTNAFTQCDVIFTPTAPNVAFKLNEKLSDPIQMFLNDLFTGASPMAGIPGISVPVGTVDGLPVGLQILANHFDEARMFQVAYAHQKILALPKRSMKAA